MGKTILNGIKMTKNEFEKKKKSIEEKKGVILKEVRPGVYRTELRG